MADDQADRLRHLHQATRIPPADLVGKLDKGFGALDYLGHAAVTDLLLSHDPCWSWEPVAWDEHGRPLCDRDKDGWARGLWIRLTVHGHTRLGYGTCAASKADAVKELIGDALRNGAMRFGLGLSLWAKEEWQDVGPADGSRPGEQPQGVASRGSAPKDPVVRAGNSKVPSAETLLKQDQAIAARAKQCKLDDATRVDVIRAVAGPLVVSGKDLSADQVAVVMRKLRWLADGMTELVYDAEGVPSLVDSRVGNPGPPPS